MSVMQLSIFLALFSKDKKVDGAQRTNARASNLCLYNAIQVRDTVVYFSSFVYASVYVLTLFYNISSKN